MTASSTASTNTQRRVLWLLVTNEVHDAELGNGKEDIVPNLVVVRGLISQSINYQQSETIRVIKITAQSCCVDPTRVSRFGYTALCIPSLPCLAFHTTTTIANSIETFTPRFLGL